MSHSSDHQAEHLEATSILLSSSGTPRAIQVLRASLEVRSGPESGQVFPIEKKVFRVGTAPGNDLILKDGTVSRFHISISAEDAGYVVRDLASTNGVKVEGIRVREAFLETGCTLTIGKTSLRFLAHTERYEIPLSAHTELAGMLGVSAGMREVFTYLSHYANLPHNVLILGETGTGKERAARALHDLGSRRAGPWEVVSCVNLPRDLIESELFGYVSGAFTGAKRDHRGAIARADGGTLFLDEIGDLPRDLQASLLRVLQEREFRPVGSGKTLRSDFRVVAATHRDLREEVNRGRFREDLYHRLAELPITLPPLRQRRDDIPYLLEHFVEQELSRIPDPSLRASLRIPPAVVERLKLYPWPGNIRQLRNYVVRLVADSSLRKLTAEDLLSDARLHAPPPEEVPDEDALVDHVVGGLVPGTQNAYQLGKRRVVDRFERAFLQHFLALGGYNVSKAAELAGMYRQEFHRVMRRHDVKRPPVDEVEGR